MFRLLAHCPVFRVPPSYADVKPLRAFPPTCVTFFTASRASEHSANNHALGLDRQKLPEDTGRPANFRLSNVEITCLIPLRRSTA